jgi:hypothetical protein
LKEVVRDRVADVAQKIGEFLETSEVGADGEFTLEQAVELLEGVDAR